MWNMSFPLPPLLLFISVVILVVVVLIQARLLICNDLGMSSGCKTHVHTFHPTYFMMIFSSQSINTTALISALLPQPMSHRVCILQWFTSQMSPDRGPIGLSKQNWDIRISFGPVIPNRVSTTGVTIHKPSEASAFTCRCFKWLCGKQMIIRIIRGFKVWTQISQNLKYQQSSGGVLSDLQANICWKSR